MPTPPSRQEVRERLASLIKEIANIPTDHIGDDATVDGELQMNSVAFVELQVAIEEDYEIQIDPVRVVELNQSGAIVDYVHHCVANVAR